MQAPGGRWCGRREDGEEVGADCWKRALAFPELTLEGRGGGHRERRPGPGSLAMVERGYQRELLPLSRNLLHLFLLRLPVFFFLHSLQQNGKKE